MTQCTRQKHPLAFISCSRLQCGRNKPGNERQCPNPRRTTDQFHSPFPGNHAEGWTKPGNVASHAQTRRAEYRAGRMECSSFFLVFNFRLCRTGTHSLQLARRAGSLRSSGKFCHPDAVSLMGWQLKESRFWKMTLMAHLPIKQSFSPWTVSLMRLTSATHTPIICGPLFVPTSRRHGKFPRPGPGDVGLTKGRRRPQCRSVPGQKNRDCRSTPAGRSGETSWINTRQRTKSSLRASAPPASGPPL